MASDQSESVNPYPRTRTTNAYLSSVIAQGRPSDELAQISSMSSTLLVRSSTRERLPSVEVTPTRTHVSRARPQPLDEHWLIVFGERRHLVQDANQRRPLSKPLEARVNRGHIPQQAITVVPSAQIQSIGLHVLLQFAGRRARAQTRQYQR
jgi:hypothetical protein